MYVNLTKTGLFRLFQQVGHFVRHTSDAKHMLFKSAEAIGWHFGLDRCVALLFDRERQELNLVAEVHGDEYPPLGERRYQLRMSSEWHQLLLEGRPLPLKDISLQSSEPGLAPQFDQFICDSQSLSALAFPLVYAGQLVGCLTMHYCRESSGFSDELLEFGETIAEELAQGVAQLRLLKERELESAIFREALLPMLCVDASNLKVLHANSAADALIQSERNAKGENSFLSLLPPSDAQRVRDSAGQLAAGGAVRLQGIVISSTNGDPVTFDLLLSALANSLDGKLLLALMPDGGTRTSAAPDLSSQSKVEELVSTLSRQLHWERIARQITSTLTSTFDRDAILQAAVDSLGRILSVSRALIVKTEGPASPLVTHEFAVPDISPLGLGRTSQFPGSAVACFKGKSASFADLGQGPKPTELSQSDLKILAEGGIVGMAGCPISHHAQYHGLILVMQSDKPRNWSSQELDLLETISEQVAVALNHASSYAQIKDQLFNINLIGNLTQQLTNVLDIATRTARSDSAADPAKPAGASPPLSSRELEVLKLIASGLANREIAQRLFLTESTVELHASRIRKKLKLKSRTALVKFACDNHLV
jgi:GAF domain-containing protein